MFDNLDSNPVLYFLNPTQTSDCLTVWVWSTVSSSTGIFVFRIKNLPTSSVRQTTCNPILTKPLVMVSVPARCCSPVMFPEWGHGRGQPVMISIN